MRDEIAERLAEAIAALDAASGPKAILAFIGSMLPFTSCLVTLHFERRRPVVLFDDIPLPHRAAVVDAYLQGAYLLDPFYNFLLQGSGDRLLRLKDIQPDRFRKSDFYVGYYVHARLADEVGLFFDLRDGARIFASLGRDREAGTFSARDIDRLRGGLPIIEALVLRQWGAGTAASGTAGSRDACVPSLEETLMRNEFGVLSKREREIVALMLKGHSSKAIAHRLGIAAGTVKNHRKGIYRKLSIVSQSELFARFLRLIGYERSSEQRSRR